MTTTISYGGALGSLAGALLAGYTLQNGDTVQALGGGPIFTVASGYGSIAGGPGVAAQSGLVLPQTGSLITSGSIAAFATLGITGGGTIASSAIVNGGLWNPHADGIGNYAVSFSSSTAWTVTNANSAQIASGTGTTVTFRGVSITVTSPVNGTTVTVTPTFN